jgi:hypothetical protein
MTSPQLHNPDQADSVEQTQAPALTSMERLMVADEVGWLDYWMSTDLRDPVVRQSLLDIFGPDAVLPADDGQYYLVSVHSKAGQRPVLLPEGPAVWYFVLGLAIMNGTAEQCQRVAVRPGVLPLGGQK